MADLAGEGTAAMATAAVWRGQPTQIPLDLYIPPDALEVVLEQFSGPLDLLLYIIRKSEMNILDIPIAEVARQYAGYIEGMRNSRLELAAEYLLMAAWLTEIKSRLLLPRPVSGAEEEEGEDPRAELVRRLQEYEQYRQAAEDLEARPRVDRDFWCAYAEPSPAMLVGAPPVVVLDDIALAMAEVVRRAGQRAPHVVRGESLSVHARMVEILERLQGEPPAGVSEDGVWPFTLLLKPEEGVRGVVVNFLPLLELARKGLLHLRQEHCYGPLAVVANGV